MNDESEEDDTRSGLNLTFWRKDIVLRHVGYDHRPEHARSVRRSRKFADQPYVLINRSFPRNTSSGVTRRTNRLVNVSSTNQGYNDHPPGRSQTPEQELPEVQVIENVMEPDNSDDQYDVYRARGQEGILSVSSRNDADSGEDRGSSHEENRNSTLDIPNETPRTRVVPFIMSPTPFSPPSESPTDTSEILATGVNNDLPNVPAAIPLTTNNDDNHNTVSNNESRTSLVRVEEHPETYEDLNGQLLRLFECPVCFEHIISPIYQCLHGHLICNKCIVMCENCPTCRNYFNTQRNLYMEKVGNLLKFPCKNTSYGCKQQMFISLKENHEQECLCRQYQCFFTDCSWKGYYSELHSHMIKNHNNYVLTGSEQFLDIVLNGENQTLKWFLSGESEYFAILIHVMESPRILKIQVNLIGPAVKAKQFKFCVQLTQRKKRSGFSQKLVYESSTLSFSEIDDALNHSGLKQNLISLSEEMIEPFIRRRTNCRLPVIFKVIPV
ncbi:E3 ubiquitin-protein ligase sina-like [Rhopalosiphum maidis]|uniref:E3 ubiquitin-protein ligase sina-like n=1 Tax=Rhopalosiphum maidis TaxID=43146 RepID=UPI000EFF3622|nr:E3 ubiquitin-protein ligase sina-like [Rhopalosiphum maidis]